MVGSTFHIEPYVQNLATLGHSEKQSLEELVERYPWCSAYRILLARCLQNLESPISEQKLHLASLYTINRSHLFHIMHDLMVPGMIPQTDTIPAVVETYTLDTEIDNSEIDSSHDNVPVVPEEHRITDQPTEIVLGSPRSNPIQEGFSVEDALARGLEEETRVEKPSPNEAPRINFDEVVQYDPTKELHPEEKPDGPEKVEIPFDRVIYNPEVELLKYTESQSKKEGGSTDFLYWLDQVNTNNRNEDNETKSEDSVSNVDEVQNLLNAFLESKRNSPRIKREFFNPEQSALQSELDQNEVVSESLAELFVRQQLYEKAIETYRKLILQNPSKSAFFAGRIKEIESLNTNT